METTYTTHEIRINKTVYAVTVAAGKFNYVNVRKVTANPFGVAGINFDTFNQAVNHYKNPTMKLELHKIELGIN